MHKPMECAHCHEPLYGRRRTYCDVLCRKRAFRRRRAGLREDELVAGRRGRIPLAGVTKAELIKTLAELRATLEPLDALRRGEELLERADTPESRRALDEVKEIRREWSE
jgi:hypothetical protein